MILEKEGRIYHDEHDIQVKITNDNTKQLKVVSVTLRGDIKDLDGAKTFVDKANELYKEAIKN